MPQGHGPFIGFDRGGHLRRLVPQALGRVALFHRCVSLAHSLWCVLPTARTLSPGGGSTRIAYCTWPPGCGGPARSTPQRAQRGTAHVNSCHPPCTSTSVCRAVPRTVSVCSSTSLCTT